MNWQRVKEVLALGVVAILFAALAAFWWFAPLFRANGKPASSLFWPMMAITFPGSLFSTLVWYVCHGRKPILDPPPKPFYLNSLVWGVNACLGNSVIVVGMGVFHSLKIGQYLEALSTGVLIIFFVPMAGLMLGAPVILVLSPLMLKSWHVVIAALRKP